MKYRSERYFGRNRGVYCVGVTLDMHNRFMTMLLSCQMGVVGYNIHCLQSGVLQCTFSVYQSSDVNRLISVLSLVLFYFSAFALPLTCTWNECTVALSSVLVHTSAWIYHSSVPPFLYALPLPYFIMYGAIPCASQIQMRYIQTFNVFPLLSFILHYMVFLFANP